jgi:hypothetical protein
MKEKMAKELKKAYSNLGLPEDVLKSVAGMVIVGLAEDADDAAIAARAKESYVEEMLKSFQSHADKIRTEAKKATQEDKNKGGEHNDDGVPQYIKDMLQAQKETNELLTKEIQSLKAANSKRSFDESVESIGKELGLTGELLGLCKAGLSTDSDEKAIRDHLGKAKKTLIDSGAKISDEASKLEHKDETDEEAERKAAEEWVKQHAKKEE